MLTLIAIRPLQGCAEYIRKCLQAGNFYYFCDQFDISKDGEVKRNRDRRPVIPDLYRINGGHTHISLSAIVGKNGDGKSTIVELMLRLINNYALCVKDLTHEDVNPTVVVKGVVAELYFRINETIYKLYDHYGEGQVKLQVVAKVVRGKEVEKVYHGEYVDSSEQLAANFFYTMVSNFSHYAYNIYDFCREWTSIKEKGNDDNERCWLYYIFHKNDGYKSPLVLNPYRDKGNININNEAYLNSQRLLSLFLDAEEPVGDRPSFRQLSGKTVRYVVLEDPGKSKLQQKTIIEHFIECRRDELLDRTIRTTKEMASDSVKKESLKGECLQLMEHIQAWWIHSNEVLLDAIKTWNEDTIKAFKEKYEDAGFLSDNCDFATWLELVRSINFGDKEDYKQSLIEGLLPYKMFNMAQLQLVGLIRYVCELMGGRDGSFLLEEDVFYLTPSEIAKPYAELTRKQKCEHYIIYKIIAIFETYLDDYKRPLRGYKSSVIGQREVPDSYVSAAINKLWYDVKQNPTHIHLKLRQALHYLKNYLINDNFDLFSKIDLEAGEDAVRVEETLNRNVPKDKKTEWLVLPLDRLKKNIEDTKKLEQLPPPIYQTDVIFVPDDKPEDVIPMESLSSGERQRLASLSCVIYHLRNLNSKKKEDVKYRNVSIVLEEIELYFHPEYQREFIKELIDMIERSGFKEIDNIHILLVTHSPFILSDIPQGNVMLLKKGCVAENGQKKQLTSFCANIYQLLDTGFFMERGAIGEFAKHYINRIVTGLNAWWEKRNGGDVDEKVLEEYPIGKLHVMIDLIDDHVIRDSLMSRLHELTGESPIDMEIERLKRQIAELELRKEKRDVVPPETN